MLVLQCYDGSDDLDHCVLQHSNLTPADETPAEWGRVGGAVRSTHARQSGTHRPRGQGGQQQNGTGCEMGYRELSFSSKSAFSNSRKLSR